LKDSSKLSQTAKKQDEERETTASVDIK